MGMSRCYSLMKCLLIIFSILFLAVGCGGVSFGAWALYDGRASESAAGRAALCALCAWSAALAAGALAALAGALRHSASLLAAAFALLALSAVAEGAAAWWGAAHLPALQEALRDALHRSVLHDYGRLHARTQVIDAIQRGLECCGAAGPRDWQRSAWARSAAEGAEGAGGAPAPLDLSVSAPPAYYWVPASCCATPEPLECAVARRLGAGAAGGPGLHGAGCAGRALAALAAAARAPLLVGAGLLVAHGAALLLALALCLRVRPPHRKV